jgi:hypothetical protein
METFKQETIHFFTGKDKKIVGRMSTGKIAIISYGYHGHWVNDGDDWLCDIVKDEEKKSIVMPVKIIRTAEENETAVQNGVAMLIENGFKHPPFHPKNAVFYTASK